MREMIAGAFEDPGGDFVAAQPACFQGQMSHLLIQRLALSISVRTFSSGILRVQQRPVRVRAVRSRITISAVTLSHTT
jgi:hypothetical protein